MRGNKSKTGPASAKSRHVPQFSFCDVGIDLVQDFVELSIGKIAFHLFIPRVGLPVVKTSRHFRPFLKAESLNGLFDLLHTHDKKLITEEKIGNSLLA